MRVLVVEDEAVLSRQLSTALGDAGYAVDCAYDGDRADFLAQTEQYDAVVLDLGLPRIAVLHWIVINIDDDGAGLEPSMREVVLHRGVRTDETSPGSGFGLAIVRDLAELYGGTIALERRLWEAFEVRCGYRGIDLMLRARKQSRNEIVIGERGKLVVVQFGKLRKVVCLKVDVESFTIRIESKRCVRDEVSVGLQPAWRLHDVIADIALVRVDDYALELSQAAERRAEHRNVVQVTHRGTHFGRFKVTEA